MDCDHCPANSLSPSTVNAIIEKYRQQRPLPQTFGKYGVRVSHPPHPEKYPIDVLFQSIVDHISDMVTNIHALSTNDLERLLSVIRQHKDKIDSVRPSRKSESIRSH